MKFYRFWATCLSTKLKKVHFDSYTKRQLIMRFKFTAFVLVISLLHVYAKGSSQTITYSAKNIKFADLFTEIKKQTHYNFVYQADMFSQMERISVHIKDEQLTQILDRYLKSRHLEYIIDQNTIIIRKQLTEQEAGLLPGKVQQDIILTGKVVDSLGKGLPGVTVVGLTSKKLVNTNDQGNYTLTVPSTEKKIAFSYIGYVRQEVEINGQATINITLKEETNNLNEVVVVGYGTKTIRQNTSSISSVTGAKLSAEPLPSFAQALAGKTAGVRANLNGGVLAEPTAIQIRGVNSISSSAQPLIVIDGVAQIPSDNLNGLRDGGGTRFDPLALLNPNDIESVEILKDAAAAVIYGSRASNGVILVTTKKGKAGIVQVNLDNKTGWSQISKKPPILRAEDYMMIQNEKARNRYGEGSPNAVIAFPSDIDQDGVPDDTDWIGLLYGTGHLYDNTLSFSGGTEKLTAFGSARYLHQEGIVKPQRIRMGQGRLNLDFKPKNWFKSGLSLAYTRSMNNGVLTDGYVQGVNISGWSAPSNVSPYNPTGPGGYNLTTGNDGGNLGLGNNVTNIGGSNIWTRTTLYNMAAMTDLTRNDNKSQDLRANIYGEITPFKDLTFTSKFGVQYISNFEDQFTPNIIGFWGVPYNGFLAYLNTDLSQWVWQNFATYNKSFGSGHTITATVGSEYQYNRSQWYRLGAVNLADPFYDTIISGAFTNIPPNQTATYDQTAGGLSSTALISYFSRISYSFNNKYFVEGAFRADAYSAFGINNQWGYFPSISVGWEATQEDFLKNINWLPYLKVRGSYGQVGNSRIRNPYASQTLYAGSAYGTLAGLNIDQVGNPELKWETAKKYDFGVDARLWDKYNIVLDYFNHNIDNMILSAPVLSTIGVPNNSIFTNIGSMRNSGIEFSLNTTLIKRDHFEWSTSFNYTHIKNKVLSLIESNNNADITSGNSVASIGRSLGTFKLIRWAGVNPENGNPRWLTAEGQVKEYQIGQPSSNAWVDENGQSVSPISASADAVYSDKSGLPTWMGGWDNTFRYKQFDLGVNVIYSGGNYIYNSTKATMLNNGVTNNFSVILDRWTTPGQVTDIPKLYLLDNQANIASTRFLEKGDFLRVRTITLGYNLPRRALDKIGFSNIRLYFQAFNPFLVTGYSGLDPDINTASRSNTSESSTASNIQLGIDALGTPQQRTYTLGLNVSF